ncbi:MAG: VanZ family protein [Kofleriaceae bacterium]|nr:VanZ family protein [Kofleriaceae bacterium]MBP6838082.1 VanZ family protein [Kofleriaceae bacterium]MBP9204692.1 VanZ family protein [Kofleriaceae bacterium]
MPPGSLPSRLLHARALGAVGALLVMVALTVASHTPGDALPPSPMDGLDKLEHALAWLVLAALLAQATAAGRGWRRLVLAVGLAIGFGVVDELHQASVPGRDSSLADLVADAIGAGLGATLAARALRRGGAAPSTPSRGAAPARPGGAE